LTVIAFSACDRHDACASSGKGGANSSHQLHCHCPEGVRLGSCLLWRGTLKLSLLIAILLTGFTRQECTITRGPVRGSHVSPIGILALSPPAFFHQSDFVAQSAVCRSRQGSEFAAGFWYRSACQCLFPIALQLRTRTFFHVSSRLTLARGSLLDAFKARGTPSSFHQSHFDCGPALRPFVSPPPVTWLLSSQRQQTQPSPSPPSRCPSALLFRRFRIPDGFNRQSWREAASRPKRSLRRAFRLVRRLERSPCGVVRSQ